VATVRGGRAPSGSPSRAPTIPPLLCLTCLKTCSSFGAVPRRRASRLNTRAWRISKSITYTDILYYFFVTMLHTELNLNIEKTGRSKTPTEVIQEVCKVLGKETTYQ